MAIARFNHVGLCVSDTEASKRFFEGVFGFRVAMEFDAPDDLTGQLLEVAEPGLHATYLRLDEFVLELLEFRGADSTAPGEKPMNTRGLTHLSFGVEPDELDTICERAVEFGGSVVESTHIGVAVMLLDPDGQRVELTTTFQPPE